MKFIYLGEDGGDDVCVVFGKTFPAGEAVECADLPEEQARKLAHNPMFAVAGAQAPGKGGRRKPSADPAPTETQTEGGEP